MSPSDETRTVQLTRTFQAPIDLVYRAWAEAEHVTKWMKCDSEATLELVDWTPRPGGAFRSRMFKPGVFEADSTGRFLEVDPPHVLSWSTDPDPKLGTPELTVRIELAEVEGGTELVLTHSGVPNHLCGIIEGGWTASLGLLQDIVVALIGAYAGAKMGIAEARRAQAPKPGEEAGS